MDGRVGELALTVRATPAQWPGLRPLAERFASRVLVRAAEILDGQAPDRVVLFRTLDMRWRLQEAALELDGEVEAFAVEIAAALEAKITAARSEPAGSDDIAVFEDEAAWRAAYWVAAVRERSVPWFFAALDREGEPPGAAADPGHRAMALAVLARLAQAGALPEVLNGLPRHGIERLVRALNPADADRQSEARAIADAARGPLAEVEADPAATPGVWETSYGGLFYLLNAALELDVGECLWKACLDERVFLARVAVELLGTEAADDVAPALFGGLVPRPRLPSIGAEAQAEIAVGLLEAIVSALPRRGLATLPRTTLGVTGERGRRLLVVTPRGSSFVLYAAPAESPAEASEALARFLTRWPASAEPPRVSPALAELDARGRVVAERGLAPTAWKPPDGADTLASAVVAQVAGVLAYLFVARSQAHDVDTHALLTERHLAIPGRIEVADETMTIELPMARLDLAVRRGGLDRNPGWVPWLRKRVALTFAGGADG